MSIAGIAKEVATISTSALLFGDELTPLNITGAAVTVCGESTRHQVGPRFGRGFVSLPIFLKCPVSLQELAYIRTTIIVKD
jgi:hypothetical protein